MLGRTQDVLIAVRQALHEQLDIRTANFSPSQRDLAKAVVGASMADLTWQSNTDPNEERRYELPRVAQDVANTVLTSATMAAQQYGNTEADFAAFVAGPRVRQIAAETRNEVSNLLARRARGW